MVADVAKRVLHDPVLARPKDEHAVVRYDCTFPSSLSPPTSPHTSSLPLPPSPAFYLVPHHQFVNTLASLANTPAHSFAQNRHTTPRTPPGPT